MPKNDGLQAAAKIREYYEQNLLPQPLVVAVTGHGDTILRDLNSEKSLFDEILVRPPLKKDIEALIQKMKEKTSK